MSMTPCQYQADVKEEEERDLTCNKFSFQVRVKPQLSEIEVDLEINVSEDNYDPQSEDLQCEKQVFLGKKLLVLPYLDVHLQCNITIFKETF